jgi:predicted transcriptional regulator of viral defense system
MQTEPSRPAEDATAAIVRLAERQHGVFGVRQLQDVGITWEEIRARAAAGWLRRVHRGVYAIAGSRLAQHGQWRAAVLACGDRAVLSHRDAAALWRLRPIPDPPISVTVPTYAGRRKRAGLVIHRSLTLADRDTTEREGIPVTGPARTILDLAASGLARRALERAIDEAERLRLCDEEELLAMLNRLRRGRAGTVRGRAGCAILSRILAEHEAGSTLTRSELEERFLALCRARGLPRPLVNASLFDFTVDFFWPQAGLVVELDGRASHGTRRAFQADRDRDSELAAKGFRTLRFTWWDVTSRPAVVAQRVRRVLEG